MACSIRACDSHPIGCLPKPGHRDNQRPCVVNAIGEWGSAISAVACRGSLRQPPMRYRCWSGADDALVGADRSASPNAAAADPASAADPPSNPVEEASTVSDPIRSHARSGNIFSDFPIG